MQYEFRHGNYEALEKLFSEALRSQGDVRMWRLYLQYVKIGAGEEVESRQTIQKAYELALGQVGVDLDSLPIYRDYLRSIMSWPVLFSPMFIDLLFCFRLVPCTSNKCKWTRLGKFITALCPHH